MLINTPLVCVFASCCRDCKWHLEIAPILIQNDPAPSHYIHAEMTKNAPNIFAFPAFLFHLKCILMHSFLLRAHPWLTLHPPSFERHPFRTLQESCKF